jgi:nucleoside-triphosphatase
MVTEETREAGSRTGFSVEDLMTGARGVLADLSHGEGPHVGKYSVNTRDLEQIGAEAVRQAINKVDVILIDELGPMELYSQFFIQSVESALGSPKHLIGTIHKRARHPLVVKVKSNPKFAVLEVTHDNRDELPKNITRRIIESK